MGLNADLSGIRTASKLLAIHPTLKILIHTAHESSQVFYAVIKRGIRAIVKKGTHKDRLVEVLKVVQRDGEVDVDLWSERIRSNIDDLDWEGVSLSVQQRKVLDLYLNGFKSNEIAQRLGITPASVYVAKYKTKLKLRARNDSDLYEKYRLWKKTEITVLLDHNNKLDRNNA